MNRTATLIILKHLMTGQNIQEMEGSFVYSQCGGESGPVSPSIVVSWNALLLESIWQYKLSNACNADETRVFYNIQLKKICNLKERAVTAVSEAKSISP